MTDGILIFTFSPVQSFIAEARRAADLYAGSSILIELAKAAIEQIEIECGAEALIYPVSRDGDAPNKIVARVPSEKARLVAQAANGALLKRWAEFADEALAEVTRCDFPMDLVWENIWKRQVGRDYFWEVYWAAAKMETEDDYGKAYRRASNALDAVKRSRVFIQPETGEPNLKDSLSGSREALHTATEDAKRYWAKVAGKVDTARIRPEGRERLDAIGAVKRFGPIADRRKFFSVSTVAAEDFLQSAKNGAPQQLAQHRDAVEQLLTRPNRVRDDTVWPYDGDLLFSETLTTERLKDSYHIRQADKERLKGAQDTLRALYKKVELSPSPYYAVIMLDGDNMGEWISDCQTEAKHREVSKKLASFAKKVRASVPDGFLVYSGGDDVLALAPLARALTLARQLAGEFKEITEGRTASVGIAIAHHLYPLDAALEATREAEKIAKRVDGKAAVAVRVIKRSGEAVTMRSKWDSMGGIFDELVRHFAEKRLSSRFAYDLSERAHIITALADDPRKATLKQLVERHKSARMTEATGLVDRLCLWVQALDKEVLPEKSDGREIPQGFAELCRWAVFARFVAQGGGD
jgi:CRISPR-associated protein Cmr2